MKKNARAVGRTDKNRIQKAIWRGIVAIYLTMVLVLVGIIPEGEPATISAAGPSKGSVTVYKYKKLKTLDEVVLKKDDTVRDIFLTYNYGGIYYAPYTNVLGDDNWPVTTSNSLFTHFDADADEFYSRNYIRHRAKYQSKPFVYGPDGNNKNNGFWIFTRDNGFKDKNSLTCLDCTYRDEGNKIRPSDEAAPLMAIDCKNGKFKIQYWYGRGSGNNYQSHGGLFFYGDSTKILGKDPDKKQASEFYFYEVQSNAYTCINKDYSIGTKQDPQVYTADADLFLKEGVTLTVPEGSVLCVKKGRFFVNGEIKCSGTILVEDGGIIEPFESTKSGSRIVLEEGGTMIIRKGGKVFAGCPSSCLGTPEGNGWLDMYAGSSIINYGILVAGQCNFKFGQATLENHKDGIMCLGCSIYSYADEKKFINCSQSDTKMLSNMRTGASDYSVVGAGLTGGKVYLGTGSNTTILKTWDGAITYIKNKSTENNGGTSLKSYSYDASGKCKIGTYTP